MSVVNISNPANPTVVSTASIGGNPNSVYVQGNYAYVTDQYTATLQVINISNPANPVVVGNVSNGIYMYSVYVQGNYAYVGNSYANPSTLEVINISNPANPVYVGSITTALQPDAIYVQGNYAYVDSYGTGTLQIFDLGGAYIQQLQAGGAEVGTLTVQENSQVNGSESIEGGLNVGGSANISGNVGINGSVIVGNSGTAVSQLYVGGSVPTTSLGSVVSTSSGTGRSVIASGNYTYVVTNTAFKIYNTANPTSPVVLSSLTLTGPTSLALQGHYAYINSYSNNSIYVVDISNPSNPVLIETFTQSNLAYSVDMYIQGEYLYLADGNSPGVFEIYNISNPYSIVNISNLELGTIGSYANDLTSVYVQGNYAYVVSYAGEFLYIINVANPYNPFQVGSAATQNVPIYVTVQGNYAYVGQTNSIQIYDISDPNAPVNVGSNYVNAPNVNDISIQGRYAYSPGSGSNIQVEDISSPTSPQLVGTIPVTGTPYAVYVQGRYLYVNTSTRLQVFDLGGSYVQQLQAGGIETGTLNVDTNAQINGNEAVAGNVTVAASLEVSGDASLGGLSIAGLSNLTPPTVTPKVTGTTTVTYAISAFNQSGQTTSASTQITNSTTPLSTTSYNAITWNGISNAQGYYVYRTATNGSPSSVGLIGTISNGSDTPTSGSELEQHLV